MGTMKTLPLMKAAVRAGLVGCLFCGLLGLGTPSASAEDLTTAVNDLATTVKEHKSAKDLSALSGDVKAIEALYKRTAGDKKARKACLKLLGNMTRTSKPDSEKQVVESALQALGRIGDPDGAKYVSTYLKQPNAKVAPTHLLTAIKAAGELHTDTQMKTLLKLVEKSKVTGVAIGAMQALAKFGHNKRTREKILMALVETVKKDKPGTRPNDRSGANPSTGDPAHVPYSYGGPTGRWNALSPALPGVLNELTGEEFHSVEDWAQAVGNYKKNLEQLFSNKDLEED